MKYEIEKFEYYLKEAEAHTKAKLNFYPDKQFYELWENVQKPRPFLIQNSFIVIRDMKFDLISSESKRIACFAWDNSEECATLIIETENWHDKLLFITDDGDTNIIRKDPEYLDDLGITYGEKLEIIFDVIYYITSNKPKINIFSLKKSEYIDALTCISYNYPKRIINVMKKLSLASIKRMINKAAEDIPHDELSNQMHLPLNGVYLNSEKTAVHNNITNTISIKKDITRSYNIKRFSNWTVISNFNLMTQVLQETAKLEQNLIIPLKNANIIEKSYDNAVFKLKLLEKHNLTEGSFLNIHIREKRKKIGTIVIDIIDNTQIYGRMRFFEPSESALIKINDMYACLQNSPTKFLANGMEQITNELNNNKMPEILTILSGLKDSSFSEATTKDIYNSKLDEFQIKALNNVVDENIPVVLIQGPPGTGKTSVLVRAAELLVAKGKRILITAPSNTAVDNICRKLSNTPALRFGNNPNSIAPDIKDKYWISNELCVINFIESRKKIGGGVYAGTHVGLLKDPIIQDEVKQNGLFDAIIFDEAGMASVAEFFLLAKLSKKTVLFGDHKQLPPFPIQDKVIENLNKTFGPRLMKMDAIIKSSAMEYLATYRKFPIIMLRKSFRCQNPRLLRFSSILFYDALVSASHKAEYFALPYHERKKIYPKGTLKLISTSNLPLNIKTEQFDLNAGKPGISNQCEAIITVQQIYVLLKKYKLNEITVISPYQKQVKLIRKFLNKNIIELIIKTKINKKLWNNFIHSNVSTVDSFQGGESDAVIISYVRSNKNNSIGFTANHNRINVAHTRCRKEMIIVGDIQCLKLGADNPVFERLERSITRDGEIIKITINDYEKLAKAIANQNLSPNIKNIPEKNNINKIEEKKSTNIKTTLQSKQTSESELNSPEDISINSNNNLKIIKNEASKEIETNLQNTEPTEKTINKKPNTFKFFKTPGMSQPDLF
jgi:predicted DNA-binding antitoxin AbrB/MazE fold protein